VQNVGYSVRPQFSPRVIAYDESGVAYSGTVDFWYWVWPPPLTRDNHMICLPSAEPLQIRAMIRYMGDFKNNHEAADRWESRYAKVLTRTRSMEPISLGPRIPRGLQGTRFTFGRIATTM
jgi:hypothetical protein